MQDRGADPGHERIRERVGLAVADDRHAERQRVCVSEAFSDVPDVRVVADRVVRDEHPVSEDQGEHERPRGHDNAEARALHPRD